MKIFGILSIIVLTISSCSGEPNQDAVADENASTNEIVTETGLKIEIIEEGKGAYPETGDLVSVHYTGSLASNGEVFDNSYDVGRPFEFPLGKGRVIQGWDEGIAKLNVGTKAKLIIPANLAYGDKDNGPIPANSDLIFVVELMDVKSAPKPILHEVFDTLSSEKIITNSGLVCHIISRGDGPNVQAGSNVRVHYYGYLTENNQKFDSSFERGEPISLQVGAGQVIPGWEEGLALLQQGDKAKLIIPSGLAYGDQGIQGVIPGGAELAFDVQIMAVE
jgi:FKBP-type peptidyl-prolyl cis-trans isomerase